MPYMPKPNLWCDTSSRAFIAIFNVEATHGVFEQMRYVAPDPVWRESIYSCLAPKGDRES
ncbi:uncharacterized protein N7515_005709 [Penicillium bovifimosum]|uniref:Uncharacterized protein n=1 Tax=Penicillium bovifimosum TaxID=126998 RepID=A0A9W9GTB0_9EURO|nr:uncharacterized protein N7515_005709 [Penicillium bovifimosum]KAJ5129670.1 hypothetical protein N7515_005709 [Penicillium bovifimosum]